MKKQDNTNTARPTRKSTTASILTKEVATKHVTCPECGGVNGRERINQPCDFCGFFLQVRLFPSHANYIAGLGTTPSGRDTYDIGDATADTLREMNAEEVIEATAKALANKPIEIALSVKLKRQFEKAGYDWSAAGIEGWIEARYEGRNPGMIRMNCGNILRASEKREAAQDGEA